MRRDSQAAWAKFQERLAELGAQLIEPLWLGVKIPHRVICAAGHQVTPRPGDTNRGVGICRLCAGKDQGAAWRHFCQLIAERGGQVEETKPLGVNVPHKVRCPAGHETTAIPSSVRIGLGFCHLCRTTSTVRAEQHFRDLVKDLGGNILEPSWLGNSKPHRVTCSQGHDTTPRPNDVKQTGSLCRVCAGHDSATAWHHFQVRVIDLGGTVVETKWLGNKVPHRILCREGHESAVRPNNVQQGTGICRTCAYKVWDAFYVVANDTDQSVKFGITSHDTRARLRAHKANGYRRTIRSIAPLATASDLERAILAHLPAAGFAPVQGREYFHIAALPLILAIVDSWQATPAEDPVSGR